MIRLIFTIFLILSGICGCSTTVDLRSVNTPVYFGNSSQLWNLEKGQPFEAIEVKNANASVFHSSKTQHHAQDTIKKNFGNSSDKIISIQSMECKISNIYLVLLASVTRQIHMIGQLHPEKTN